MLLQQLHLYLPWPGCARGYTSAKVTIHIQAAVTTLGELFVDGSLSLARTTSLLISAKQAFYTFLFYIFSFQSLKLRLRERQYHRCQTHCIGLPSRLVSSHVFLPSLCLPVSFLFIIPGIGKLIMFSFTRKLLYTFMEISKTHTANLIQQVPLVVVALFSGYYNLAYRVGPWSLYFESYRVTEYW